MITIPIIENGIIKYARSAKNITYDLCSPESVKTAKKQGFDTYMIDTGKTVIHNQEDGDVELYKKLLNTIKEV